MIGMKKSRERAVFIDFTGDDLVEVLCPGHRGAIGHLEGDFFAVTVENFRHCIQRHKDIGLQAAARCSAFEEGLADGLEGACRVDGVVKLCNQLRGARDRHRPRCIAAAVDSHALLRRGRC